MAETLASPTTASPLRLYEGDPVVLHGSSIGYVQSVETATIGEETLELLVINFPNEKAVRKLPTTNFGELGLRNLSSKEELEALMQVLQAPPALKSNRWKARQDQLQKYCDSAALVDWGTVVRSLHDELQGEVQFAKNRLYQAAREKLVTEMALVLKLNKGSVNTLLDRVLNGEAVAATQLQAFLKGMPIVPLSTGAEIRLRAPSPPLIAAYKEVLAELERSKLQRDLERLMAENTALEEELERQRDLLRQKYTRASTTAAKAAGEDSATRLTAATATPSATTPTLSSNPQKTLRENLPPPLPGWHWTQSGNMVPTKRR